MLSAACLMLIDVNPDHDSILILIRWLKDFCRAGRPCKTDVLKVSHLWQESWMALGWDRGNPPHSPEPRRSFFRALFAELEPKRQFTCMAMDRKSDHITWHYNLSKQALTASQLLQRRNVQLDLFDFAVVCHDKRKSRGVLQHRSRRCHTPYKPQPEPTRRVLVLTSGTAKENTKTREFPWQIHSFRWITKSR